MLCTVGIQTAKLIYTEYIPFSVPWAIITKEIYYKYYEMCIL